MTVAKTNNPIYRDRKMEADVNVEPKREPAVWVRYSTTMMECSRCGRHTARHRFEYCPHCGAPMRERKEE